MYLNLSQLCYQFHVRVVCNCYLPLVMASLPPEPGKYKAPEDEVNTKRQKLGSLDAAFKMASTAFTAFEIMTLGSVLRDKSAAYRLQSK